MSVTDSYPQDTSFSCLYTLTMTAMRTTITSVLLLTAYYVVTFGIVNLGFPIGDYLRGFTYPKSYVVSSFLLLCLMVTLFTALGLPLLSHTKRPLWGRVMAATVLQFALVSAFAIACSGFGFGWSVNSFSTLMRLSFFFAEFEWLRFILEAAVPLAGFAAFAYYLLARTYPMRG